MARRSAPRNGSVVIPGILGSLLLSVWSLGGCGDAGVDASALPGAASFDPSSWVTDPVRGEQVYKVQKCHICHKIQGRGGSRGRELDALGERRDRDWLRAYVPDPRSRLPDSRMPAFNKIDRSDLEALLDYLMTL